MRFAQWLPVLFTPEQGCAFDMASGLPDLSASLSLWGSIWSTTVAGVMRPCCSHITHSGCCCRRTALPSAAMGLVHGGLPCGCSNEEGWDQLFMQVSMRGGVLSSARCQGDAQPSAGQRDPPASNTDKSPGHRMPHRRRNQLPAFYSMH
jgi:hypothetical protein